MKKLIFIFTVLSVLTALSVLTSCRQRRGDESYVYFDEEEFKKMKAAWEKQNLKNYSFEYRFEDMPPFHHFTGKVRVIDRKGSVKIEHLLPKPLRKPHSYYIASMDELFEAIYKRYESDKKRLKERVRAGEYLRASTIVKYDEKNFYPLKLDIDSSIVRPFEQMEGGWYNAKLTVSNFKITEQFLSKAYGEKLEAGRAFLTFMQKVFRSVD